MAASDFFNVNGTRKTECQIRETLEKKYNTTILTGVREITEYSGYRYSGLHKFGRVSRGEHIAIRQTEGEYICWESEAIPTTAEGGATFIFDIAMGNGAAYIQPTGRFDLYAGEGGEYRKLVSFTVLPYSNLWQSDNGVRLFFECTKKAASPFGAALTLDEFICNDSLAEYGIAYLSVPPAYLSAGKPMRFMLKCYNRSPSNNWCRISTGVGILSADIFEGIEKVHIKDKHVQLQGYTLLIGDIHAHSGESHWLNGSGCGIGSRKEMLEYAKNVSCMDFCCLTEHDWQIDEVDWNSIKHQNDLWNKDNSFSVLHGFEWTSYIYGHRNVYYKCRPKAKAVFDSFYQKVPVLYGRSFGDKDPSPLALWDWLDEQGDEAITVGHHTNATMFLEDYDKFYSEKYDKLVEIYSNWGSSMDADDPANFHSYKSAQFDMRRQLKDRVLGFAASSDAHDGNPGNSSISLHHDGIGTPLGSGRVAVLAKSFTRESIYEALKSRCCYALTCAPIVLWFSIDGQPMGSVIAAPQCDGIHICSISIKGTDELKSVKLFNGNRRILTRYNIGSCELDLNVEIQAQAGMPADYHVEVRQQDGQAAWSSPIFFR